MIGARTNLAVRMAPVLAALAAFALALAPSAAEAQPGGRAGQRGDGGGSGANANAMARAVLDRARVAVGDSTLLTVSVEGGDADSTPVAPAVPGLEIRFLDASRSTSIMIINGRQTTSGTVQYRYRVDVQAAGRHDIPPIPVLIGGRVVNTQPLTLIASEPDKNADYFVELEATPQQAYVGEPVRLRATWYVSGSVSNLLFNLPGLDKLRLTEAPDPRPPGTRQDDSNYPTVPYIGGPAVAIVVDNVEHNGRIFSTVTLDRIVTASTPGTYTIGPLRVAFDAAVANQRSNIGLPFPSRGQRMVVASNSVTLDVLPLPSQGRPPGFDGLVGDYKLAASASNTSVRAGDPIDLSWKITGSVTASTVPPMVLTSQRELAEKFRVPVEPVVPRIQGRDAVFGAQVRPRPGATRIPPVALSVFDTKLKQYRVIKSEPIALDLLPGGLVSSDEPTPSASEESAQTAALRPIPAMPAAIDPSTLAGPTALAFMLAPPGLASLFALGTLVRRHRAGDAVTQTRIAGRRALRALRRIDPARSDAADRAAGALGAFEQRVRSFGGGVDLVSMAGVAASIDRFDRRRFAGRPVVIERRDLEQAAAAVRAVIAPTTAKDQSHDAKRLASWLLVIAVLALPAASRADTHSPLDNVRSAESLAISDPIQARALAATALDELAPLAAGPAGRSAPLHLAMARAYGVTGDIGREQLALRRAARLVPWSTLALTGEADGAGAASAKPATGELAGTQPTPMAWAGYVRAVDAPIRLWCLVGAWIVLCGAIAVRVVAPSASTLALAAVRLIIASALVGSLALASVALDALQSRAQSDEVVLLKPVTPRSGPDDVVFPAVGQSLPAGTLAHIANDGPAPEPGWARIHLGAEDAPVWVRATTVERVVP